MHPSCFLLFCVRHEVESNKNNAYISNSSIVNNRYAPAVVFVVKHRQRYVPCFVYIFRASPSGVRGVNISALVFMLDLFFFARTYIDKTSFMF